MPGRKGFMFISKKFLLDLSLILAQQGVLHGVFEKFLCSARGSGFSAGGVCEG